MTTLSVIGTGAWGTALALTAQRAGSTVSAYNKHPSPSDILEKHHIPLVHTLEDAAKSSILVIAIPTQNIPELLIDLKSFVTHNTILVMASKGIHIESGKFITEMTNTLLPGIPVTVLSGPNFAHEVSQNLPAATTLGYTNKTAAEFVSTSMSHSKFRIYLNDDVMGVQIGGSLKNVLAVACGFVKELQLGENAMAALLTRGMAEIKNLALKKGAKAETLWGLSGMGDLVLTCMGSQSRNLQFGQQVVRLKSAEKALEALGTTVEGYHTAKALLKVAADLQVNMPICHAVYKILYENLNPLQAIELLMTRPLKHEG